jgi:plasmid stability protein
MATLYVRDVPQEVYDALRARAEEEGRSISAEAIALLKKALEDETEARRRQAEHMAALKRMGEISDSITLPPGYPGSVELLRKDRAR